MKPPPAVTDSAWFWVLVYSSVPLLGLALLSQKYGERQSRLERQYQGHLVAAEKKIQKLAAGGTAPAAAEQSAGSQSSAPSYSSSDETIIPLTPLVLIFAAITFFAAVMLSREQLRLRREAASQSHTGGSAGP
jgi:hypothetical protein